MKKIEYTISDSLGIHARPAGLLVKLAKNYQSNITITKQETTVDAKKLMALLGLGVTHGTKVVLTFEGIDEEKAAEDIYKFFEENL